MDKIEKLEITRQPGKELNHLDKNLASLVDKINEIVDVLNQSQKQPKGETIRNYNPEKRWDKYKKSKIEVREFDLVPKVQPEKQEGWRELSVNTRRILKTLGYYFSDGNEHYSCPVCGIDVVRLDQLLSERTREAKIEVLEKVLEKKTNYEIEREEHGYRVTLEYVLADDIKKEIKLLKERK
ncbi:MAG TPA: hypothetical protein PKI16_03495 [Candidatus Dojkabacteria bacterium]|nr:hypothetical protein [Candidatus Dojkabacteria bacterium]